MRERRFSYPTTSTARRRLIIMSSLTSRISIGIGSNPALGTHDMILVQREGGLRTEHDTAT
jgi:hypothetical protein